MKTVHRFPKEDNRPSLGGWAPGAYVCKCTKCSDNFLGAKKSVHFGTGTLRDDTLTFAFLLSGTILILGTLLFLPVATLGPLAEHLGPHPFGG